MKRQERNEDIAGQDAYMYGYVVPVATTRQNQSVEAHI